MFSKISLQYSDWIKSKNSKLSLVRPKFQIYLSNLGFFPPVKNSNSNTFLSSLSSSSPILFNISFKLSIFSLDFSEFFFITSLTFGKISCSCPDKFVSLISGVGFLGVTSIVLVLSSIICVYGLAKLSIDGLEGRGAIFGNLFLNGDNDSGNKKLVSRGVLVGCGKKSSLYAVGGGV